MYRALVIRAGWTSLCLLMIATVSFSQPAPSATPSPTPSPSPAPLRIIYTGKFLGYLRVPSLQPLNPTLIGTCPDASSTDSQAAIKFLAGPIDPKEREKFDNSIRVSTGDNFAPQLEARVFDFVQPNPEEYKPGNKELYDWWDGNWVRPIDLSPANQQLLEKEKALGRAIIPTDNVACFLSAAKYTAVVPGKHDFYFGAERVRLLARFMAGLHQADFKPVQMLGANLVIKTSPIEAPQTTTQKPRSKWSDESTVVELREGKSVYPWFSSPVRIQVPIAESLQDDWKAWLESPTPSDLKEFLKKKAAESKDEAKDKWTKLRDEVTNLESVWVCPANDFNEVSLGCQRGWQLYPQVSKLDSTRINYSMPILPRPPATLTTPPGRDLHYATFEPGKNYGLCQRDQNQSTNDKEVEKGCLSFSIFRPFFNFPHEIPLIGTKYNDPDPFVVIRDKADHSRDVAIFGVVDPNIAAEVGLLNFSWSNEDGKLKTVVSAEDPAEALQEEVVYFKEWYKRNGWGDFKGLKVLLAQMSPQLARVLVARLPSLEFQVVVTAADQEQGTSETRLSTEWKSGTSAGTFVAVPLPYYDPKDKKNEGTVHLGMIEASPSSDGKSSKFLGNSLSRVEVPATKSDAGSFWKKVEETLPNCMPGFKLTAETRADRVKWLTLCAMRERLGADVALIQKRDFFDGPDEGSNDIDDIQHVLDRKIWKGDLLTLMYVPGSALKKALDLSKRFDTDDKNQLSLESEKLRGLEYLGVTKPGKDYLINEMPLDEKKVYAVATTDYIGAGDTGYPDLATAALDPKTSPSQYPGTLESISGVVCRKLSSNQAEKYCLPDMRRDTYLDKIAVNAPPSPRPPSFGRKLHDLFPFKAPKDTEAPKKAADALEQKAQHHPIWMLSLKNFSVGFLSLSNNLTDAQLGQKFAAVSTSGVTAKKSHTITIGLGTRLSRSSHLNEFFVSMGIDYSEQSIGDVAPNISQLKNRLTGDAGLIRNIKGGRSKDRVGIAFTLHVETPLQQPFTTFTLGTKDKDTLKITQNRSVLLLPRIGMRWQNGDNFFEVGGQVGREIQAFSGYRFNTQGSIVECLPSATQTFAACITEKSTSPMTAITKDSAATAILRNRPRAGLYWKYGLSIPFGPKVKYDINQEGNQEADFFFNFDQDNSADTRFLDRSKHSLKFTIWPSFSIGPSLQFLLYRNKVNHDFLFQKQFGFEANFSFNLSNHREKMVQIKHKP